MKLSTNLDQYTQKRKDKRQKQKQSYNERNKNSKAENKATREKSNSKWDVYKRNQREKKKIETIRNAIFIFMFFFLFLGANLENKSSEV